MIKIIIALSNRQRQCGLLYFVVALSTSRWAPKTRRQRVCLQLKRFTLVLTHTHRSQNSANLINELSAKLVAFIEYFCPQLWISSSHKVPCQAFEQRVFIADLDKTKTHHGIKNVLLESEQNTGCSWNDCLWLLQRLTIALYLNELCITLSSFISYACQVGISFLTIFANNFAVIVGVFPEKEKILIVKCG